MIRRSILTSAVVWAATAGIATSATIYVNDFMDSGYVEADPATWVKVPILNAPGQTLDLMVTGGETITGAQVYLHVGNGDLVRQEPLFTSIDFAGGIFDTGRDVSKTGPAPGGPGPQPNFEQFLDAGIAFDNAGDTTIANGKIATVEIDASGFAAGSSFPLMLTWAGTDVYGDPSTLIGASALIQHAVLTMVPEPTTIWQLLALLGMGVLGLFFRRRKQQAS